MPGVGIVVLAAGGSSRMGRPKQLLPIAGQSMLRHAASAAVDSGCTPAVIVLGAHAGALWAELSGLPVSVVVNDAWQRGLGTSIRCGIQRLLNGGSISPKYAPSEKYPFTAEVRASAVTSPDALRAAVILLGDQPFISADSIRRLVSAQINSGKSICVSAFSGTFGPPVVVGSQCFELLLQLPDDQGAKAIWATRPDQVHFEPCPEAAIDVDTPLDYQALKTTNEERDSQ